MTAQLRRIVHTHAFDVAILAVIVANAIVLGLQTYPGMIGWLLFGEQLPED
jgi:hypothetical protein